MKLKKGNTRRAKWWDYTREGHYFVTLNIFEKSPFFGKIKDGEVVLSEEGKLAESLWKEMPERFPFVKLDEFVIMPDHVHGILMIGNALSSRSTINGAPTDLSSFKEGCVPVVYNSMIQDHLSKVIKWYKGRLTFEIRKFNKQFAWQTRFHDKIIKSEFHLEITRAYIRQNPSKANTSN